MAKNKIHLSDQAVKSIPLGSKRIEYYDDHLIKDGKLIKKGIPGLALRVSPGGTKTFFFSYWHNRTSNRITIGTYPTISLAYAREKALEVAALVADGQDPNRLKQLRKSDKPISLGEYIDRFEKEYVLRRNKLKVSTRKDYQSRLRRLRKEKSLSGSALIDITRADIRSFLKQETENRPYNANRLHSLLSKIFNEAVEDGHIPKNPIDGMKKLSIEKPRDVSYSKEDIKNIWLAISDEDETTEGFIKMLLITGQRKGETSLMKWSNVNLDDQIWHIPSADTKKGKDHIVPLSDVAIRILLRMKKINPESEYVFPSLENKSKHITHIKRPTDRIRLKTKLPHFRCHDLRHIVATEMINLGIDFIHIGKVLNHKALAGENAITARYINNEYTSQKRRAMNLWSDYLTKLVSPLSMAK